MAWIGIWPAYLVGAFLAYFIVYAPLLLPMLLRPKGATSATGLTAGSATGLLAAFGFTSWLAVLVFRGSSGSRVDPPSLPYEILLSSASAVAAFAVLLVAYAIFVILWIYWRERRKRRSFPDSVVLHELVSILEDLRSGSGNLNRGISGIAA